MKGVDERARRRHAAARRGGTRVATPILTGGVLIEGPPEQARAVAAVITDHACSRWALACEEAVPPPAGDAGVRADWYTALTVVLALPGRILALSHHRWTR